jgi:hypothetical protein
MADNDITDPADQLTDENIAPTAERKGKRQRHGEDEEIWQKRQCTDETSHAAADLTHLAKQLMDMDIASTVESKGMPQRLDKDAEVTSLDMADMWKRLMDIEIALAGQSEINRREMHKNNDEETWRKRQHALELDVIINLALNYKRLVSSQDVDTLDCSIPAPETDDLIQFIRREILRRASQPSDSKISEPNLSPLFPGQQPQLSFSASGEATRGANDLTRTARETVRMRETKVRRMDVAKAERLAREARKRNYGRVGCNDNAPREIGGGESNRKLQDEGKSVGHQRARKMRKARYRCQISSLDLDVEEELARLESELDRCLQQPERRLRTLSMSSTKAVANLDLSPKRDRYAFFR